jgi:hypothetical protein
VLRDQHTPDRAAARTAASPIGAFDGQNVDTANKPDEDDAATWENYQLDHTIELQHVVRMVTRVKEM